MDAVNGPSLLGSKSIVFTLLSVIIATVEIGLALLIVNVLVRWLYVKHYRQQVHFGSLMQCCPRAQFIPFLCGFECLHVFTRCR